MSELLEAYEAERADFERVIAAVRKVQAATLEDLRSVDWVVDVIREIGLVPIPEAGRTYADEAEYLNSSQQGLIQIPREFARWLVLLSEQRVKSYLEIGCFNGASATLAAAYLQRFEPEFRATSIDIFPGFVFHGAIKDLVPLEYVVGKTSYDFRGQEFDAVFIDGDHSFEWAHADYENCGKAARVCGLHDVNNAPYRELVMGGVPGMWELIKAREHGEMVEIFEHPEGEELLGIGVRIRES
jgi:SAM-dependent methyltransferase